MFSLRSNKRGSSQNLSLGVKSKVSSLQLCVLQVILDYGFQGRNFAPKSYKLFLSKSKFLKFSKFNQINPFPRQVGGRSIDKRRQLGMISNILGRNLHLFYVLP